MTTGKRMHSYKGLSSRPSPASSRYRGMVDGGCGPRTLSHAHPRSIGELRAVHERTTGVLQPPGDDDLDGQRSRVADSRRIIDGCTSD